MWALAASILVLILRIVGGYETFYSALDPEKPGLKQATIFISISNYADCAQFNVPANSISKNHIFGSGLLRVYSKNKPIAALEDNELRYRLGMRAHARRHPSISADTMGEVAPDTFDDCFGFADVDNTHPHKLALVSFGKGSLDEAHYDARPMRRNEFLVGEINGLTREPRLPICHENQNDGEDCNDGSCDSR
jgi:hypothetical protein